MASPGPLLGALPDFWGTFTILERCKKVEYCMAHNDIDEVSVPHRHAVHLDTHQ